MVSFLRLTVSRRCEPRLPNHVCYQTRACLVGEKTLINYQQLVKRCSLRLNRKSNHPSFLWEYRIFHIFDVDHFICDECTSQLPLCKKVLQLFELPSLARKCFRNTSPESRTRLGYQISTRQLGSVISLDTLSFHDRPIAPSSFHCSSVPTFQRHWLHEDESYMRQRLRYWRPPRRLWC